MADRGQYCDFSGFRHGCFSAVKSVKAALHRAD
jgi:hypothetical protein